jgi:hypothetical protein
MTNRQAILISIAMILFLSFLNYWRFKNFNQTLSKNIPPKIEIPEMKIEELPLFGGNETKEEKEWVSPDGKLKLKYPASWMEENEIFSKIFQEEATLKDSKILLFVQNFDLKNQALNILTVGEISPEKKLEDILEEIKKMNLEILSVESENGTATIEAKTKEKRRVSFRAKEKIFFGKEKTYLVSFISFEKNWEKVKEVRERIFESIEFVP